MPDQFRSIYVPLHCTMTLPSVGLPPTSANCQTPLQSQHNYDNTYVGTYML